MTLSKANRDLQIEDKKVTLNHLVGDPKLNLYLPRASILSGGGVVDPNNIHCNLGEFAGDSLFLKSDSNKVGRPRADRYKWSSL